MEHGKTFASCLESNNNPNFVNDIQCNDSFMRHVGYKENNVCIKKYYSEQTVRMISNKLTQLLMGVDPQNRPIIVPDKTICHIMDSVYDKKQKDDILVIRLAISDQDTGELSCLVPVNFVHAISLAAAEKASIMISDDVLEKMVPKDSEEFDKINDSMANKSSKSFPEDKNILDIARQIMSGKIKDKKNKENK